jgi:hypothetical protein
MRDGTRSENATRWCGAIEMDVNEDSVAPWKRGGRVGGDCAYDAVGGDWGGEGVCASMHHLVLPNRLCTHASLTTAPLIPSSYQISTVYCVSSVSESNVPSRKASSPRFLRRGYSFTIARPKKCTYKS